MGQPSFLMAQLDRSFREWDQPAQMCGHLQLGVVKVHTGSRMSEFIAKPRVDRLLNPGKEWVRALLDSGLFTEDKSIHVFLKLPGSPLLQSIRRTL